MTANEAKAILGQFRLPGDDQLTLYWRKEQGWELLGTRPGTKAHSEIKHAEPVFLEQMTPERLYELAAAVCGLLNSHEFARRNPGAPLAIDQRILMEMHDDHNLDELDAT